MITSGQTPKLKDPRSGDEARTQVQPTPKNKSEKQRQKGWYIFKKNKKKKTLAPFLRLPEDVLWVVFEHFFTGVHMTDIKTTQRGTIQRSHGAQSLLFVCKMLRDFATTAMFRFATFDIPHFKLHEKHIRENGMTTLNRIQNLVLLWTPPPSRGFTTIRGDDAYILRTIDRLRSVEIWLLASQHLRIQSITEPDEISRTELHEAMLAKFESTVQSHPKWLKRLLRDAPLQFKDVKMLLVGLFAFGTVKEVDLYASSPTYIASNRSLLTYRQATHISWPSRSVGAMEIVKWVDWARTRTGMSRGAFRNVTQALAMGFPMTGSEFHLRRSNLFPRTGDRVFGRKVY